MVCSLQDEQKRNLSLGGHVGFDSLPDQLVSKSVSQGFCFNILCVGTLLFLHLHSQPSAVIQNQPCVGPGDVHADVSQVQAELGVRF